MRLRRFGFLRFCALCVLTTAFISTEAAPLERTQERNRRFSYHRRQTDIGDLVGNITGNPVSDDAGLAQTLGRLFGGSSNSSSSTSDSPSTTISDSLVQSTGGLMNLSIPSMSFSDDFPLPTSSNAAMSFAGGSSDPSTTALDGLDPIISHFTSTGTFPVPTGTGDGSEAGDVNAIFSELEKLLPTSVPTVPVGGGSGSGSSSSGGFSGFGSKWDPEDASGDPSTYPSQNGYDGQGGPGSQIPDCAETYTVISGDTCAAISSVFDLSAADFLRMNPTVGTACMNLQVGQEYCVQKGSGDAEEDADDEDGEYGQYTTVHVHNHSHNAHCACQGSQSGTLGGYPPNSISTVLPFPVSSAPAVPSMPSDLPVPPPIPPSDPSLNSTDQISTPDLPIATPPSLNSTDLNSTSSSDPLSSDPDSTATGITQEPSASLELGDSPPANHADSAAASSTSSLDPDDPLASSDGSDGTGMGSRAAPASAPPSGLPKTVISGWSETIYRS
ncbi:hypothetical protein C8R43DRAFT_27689 [Mycena crocata]|nr:hypothetical protein C8R43DRAFT_27689 [Mycena crocata]